MTLTLELSIELQKRLEAAAKLQGVAPDEYALRVLNEKLEDPQRRQQAVAVLRSLRDPNNAAQQQETMEFLIQALDEDRTSDRKLFPPDQKGKSW
jgi:hypothetical protein